NCQNCYSACQYTAPHEFALNLPGILSELRQESWENTAWPASLGRAFHRNGTLIACAAVIGFALLFWLARLLPGSGQGFYALLGHGAMTAIFLPAFVLPLAAIAVSLRR